MKLSEKYLEYGIKGVNEQELLEVLLYCSGYNMCLKSKAKNLINKYGNLKTILSQDDKVLLKNGEINTKFLIIKKLINEFFYEDYLKRLRKFGPILSNSSLVIEFLKQQFAYELKEKFGVLFLNTNYEFIKYESFSFGTIDKTIIFIREVTEKVLLCNAKNIIIVHNHPSGVMIPSDDDIRITRKLKEGLLLLEINLVDHILITHMGYFSFMEKGVL